MGSFPRYPRASRTRVNWGRALTPAIRNILIACTAVFLVQTLLQLLFRPSYTALLNHVAGLVPWLVTHRLFVWQPVTYLFLHGGIFHLLFNMLFLWMFGSDIEGIYGKRLFWKMYLSLIVLSGICWVVTENWVFHRDYTHAVGASGAVMGVIVLYILHFPRRVVLLFGVLPVPVWLLGVVWLGSDYIGFLGEQRGRMTTVAHAAHLGGALFGWVFYRTHFTLFSLLPTHWLSKLRGSPRSRMRVVRPDDVPEEETLEAEVDRILAKISQQGTESLTQAEIRTLEAASRRAQRRRGARLD
jgi:rhomboid family protein